MGFFVFFFFFFFLSYYEYRVVCAWLIIPGEILCYAGCWWGKAGGTELKKGLLCAVMELMALRLGQLRVHLVLNYRYLNFMMRETANSPTCSI